jgi:hypothetical protein
MSKSELIDAIRRHNRTVSPEFLSRFGENDLKAYLDRVSITTPMAPPPRMRTTVDSKQDLVLA